MLNEISLSIFKDSELIGIILKTVIAIILLSIVLHLLPKRKTNTVQETEKILPFLTPSVSKPKYTRKDYFIIFSACISFAMIAFTNLGTTTFPTTTWQPQKTQPNQSFILQLDGFTHCDAIYAMYGEGDNNSNDYTYQLGFQNMIIEGSYDLQTWEEMAILPKGAIYEYTIIQGNWDYTYIRITSANVNQTFTEIGFKQFNTDAFLPVSVYEDDHANSDYPAELVIDEQDKLVVHPTYYDEAYFDEVYHPRNAWEVANGQHMYATVHPLLGTNIMALFIKLFGFSPFVYRLPGVLFGIAIIPIFYAITKLFFKDYLITTLATVLCTYDFMHLTTSRIATLEPYSVFFILVMFYFMLRYYQTSFYDTELKQTLKLLLWSGIFMGVAIATKWTACYSAVGLAILLFTNLGIRFKEYLQAKKYYEETEDDNAYNIVKQFPYNFWTTIMWCFVFFIFIPIIIYWCSYLVDHVWRNDTWSIANVWSQNLYMYNYHAGLEATHPYQSTWYMWLLDIRPIWYYSGVQEYGISYSIACFSNPLLTWVGLPCVLFTIYHTIRYRNTTGWMILVGYFTALLPWVLLVNRCVFAYHFYPTSFFTMLAIVYCANIALKKKAEYARPIIITFIILYILCFILFLPVTAGFGTTKAYIKFLEWFPTWYFG